jgi:Transmembrane secretion effector
MSSAGTLPFFLFTLPAGALADLVDRRRLLRVFNCWLVLSAGLLAVCALWNKLSPEIILGGVFLLGTGFAFQAPVASASIPDTVSKEQLPSAIALGGIQMNLAGIIGPAVRRSPHSIGRREHSFCHERLGVRSRAVGGDYLEAKKRRTGHATRGLLRFSDWCGSIHAVCAWCLNRSAAEFHLWSIDWSDPGIATGNRSKGSASRPAKPRVRIYMYGDRLVGWCRSHT